MVHFLVDKQHEKKGQVVIPSRSLCVGIHNDVTLGAVSFVVVVAAAALKRDLGLSI